MTLKGRILQTAEDQNYLAVVHIGLGITYLLYIHFVRSLLWSATTLDTLQWMYLLPKEPQNILLKEIITMNSNKYRPPNTKVQLSLPTIKLIKYAFGIKRLKIPKIWQHFPTKPGNLGYLFWLLKRKGRKRWRWRFVMLECSFKNNH